MQPTISLNVPARESAAADPSRLKNRYPGDSVLPLSCMCAIHALEPLRSLLRKAPADKLRSLTGR